jgi:hypothetical protein
MGSFTPIGQVKALQKVPDTLGGQGALPALNALIAGARSPGGARLGVGPTRVPGKKQVAAAKATIFQDRPKPQQNIYEISGAPPAVTTRARAHAAGKPVAQPSAGFGGSALDLPKWIARAAVEPAVQGARQLPHDVASGDWLGSGLDVLGVATVLPPLRGARAVSEAAQAYRRGSDLAQGARAIEAARAAGASYKAGQGVLTPAVKAGARSVRKVVVGSAELEVPAAGSRAGRAGESLATAARTKIGTGHDRTSLTGRLANAIGTSPEKIAGGQLNRVLVTRTRAMGAAAAQLRKVGGKLDQAQEYALRIMAEHSLPGNRLSVAARQTFHASRIQGSSPEEALAHNIHADLIEKAKPYLNEHSDGSIALAPNAPKALHESWRLVQKVAGGREDVYRQIGLLHDQQIAERVQGPARVLGGAKYVEATPGKLGKSKALDVATAERDRLGSLHEKALDQEAKWHMLTNAGHTIEGLPPESNPYRNRIVRLGVRLEAAQAKVDRLDAAAARRVTPTGLVGAEDTTAGRVYTAYARALPKANKNDAGLVSRFFGKAAAFSRGSAIGAGPQDRALKHSFTGNLLESGMFDPAVTASTADKMMVAVHVSNAHLAREVMLAASHDRPKTIWDVAIKVDPTKNVTEEMKALSDRLNSVRTNPLRPEDLDHVDWSLAEALRQDMFPKELEGVPTAAVAEKILTGQTQPLENYRWLSPDLVEASGLLRVAPAEKHLGVQVLSKVGDSLNSAVKGVVIYLRPAYMPVNLLGNLAMNVLQQGYMLPRELYRAAWLHKDLLPEDRLALDHLMGSGTAQAGKLNSGNAMGHLADWMGVVVDRIPRRASFLFEARKLGYRDNTAIRDLLQHGAAGDAGALHDLEYIRTKAADAIVDYERLSPTEKQVIARVVFVYPWLKGASRYGVRYTAEHTVVTMALALAADHAHEQANLELGKRPYYTQFDIPLNTASLGLSIPGVGGVGADQLIGQHEIRRRGLPYVINPGQAITQQTPAEILAGAIGMVSGNTGALGSLANDINPLLGDAASTLIGYDPNRHKEIPKSFGSLGKLLWGNVGAWQVAQRINSADPYSNKLYPRTKTEQIEAAVLSGLAPTPYNTSRSGSLAPRSGGGFTPIGEGSQSIFSARPGGFTPIGQVKRSDSILRSK